MENVEKRAKTVETVENARIHNSNNKRELRQWSGSESLELVSWA
jgi:hypothetical protein